MKCREWLGRLRSRAFAADGPFQGGPEILTGAELQFTLSGVKGSDEPRPG
jgi:hypothetical protein